MRRIARALRFCLIATLMLLTSVSALAQWEDPVSFSVTKKRTAPNEITVTFRGTIELGWHVYSTDIGSGGPTPATFNTDKSTGIKPLGKLKAVGNVKRMKDPVFNMEVSYMEGVCVFEQKLQITDKNYSLKGYLEYGACNDRNCMPPTAVDVSVEGTDGPAATEESTEPAVVATEDPSKEPDKEAKTDTLPATVADTANTAATDSIATIVEGDLWSSMVDELKSLGTTSEESNTGESTSLLWLFLMGIVGGLIALFTPCVWPIIPMTVSFFLKRSEKKSRGVLDAIIYGLSIIVIYVGMGLAITLIFGASALNALSTNAIVNIFFCLLLIIFGVSFLGFFELTLPSSWSNKADAKAGKTSGLISIFIMAFTLALVSFSCTGPIIGFMLVEVASLGNIAGPLVCMFGFALALALPFSFFAMSPALLKKMPKSGKWMNTIKVILGFVELAFSLKFLSVADLAYGWHILDREVFIIIWLILAILLGCYLAGWLKLPIDGKKKSKPNKVRIILAVLSFAFAIYLVPGLLGKPLPAISAFTPPMYTQHIRLFGENVEAKFTNYEEGMAYAREHNMNVLLDFTGYGCVNCREMEQKVWNDPQVAKMLTNDVVLISLYVDDKTALPEHIEVVENGHTTTLRTVGDRWSYLQRVRFGANAQPFYVLTAPDGHPLKPAYTFDTDVDKFIVFLGE